jgi:hypothetical protein
MIKVGVAECDQLHSSGRRGFEIVREHVKRLRAQGITDDAQIVGHLMSDLGSLLLSKLGGVDGEDDAFWSELWRVCSALAYGATEVKDS